MEIKGAPVTVRAFRGTALARWLVEVGENVAYITDEKGYRDLQIAGTTERVVGFPKGDVFRRDRGGDGEGPVDWRMLTPFF